LSGTTQQFKALTVNSSWTGSADSATINFSNQGTTLTAGIGYNVAGTGGNTVTTLNGIETLTINAIDLGTTGATAFAGITNRDLSSLTATTAGNVTLGTITAAGVLGTGALTSINLAGVTGTNASTFTLANNTINGALVITGAVNGNTITNTNAQDTTDQVIFTGNVGVDNMNNAGFTGVVVADGKAGNDILVGGSGADALTGGEGADRVTGGIANDAIVLTETVAAIDQVQFVNGAGTSIAQYAAANGSDTVTGFATANDIVVFAQTLLAIDNTATIAFQTGATNTAIANGTTVYEIAGSIGVAGAAGLVANLGTAATIAGIDAGDALVFIQYTAGNNMEVYYFVDASGADVAAAELTLVGTFSGITADAFAAANIAQAFA
jgi:hypothetical protein